MHETKINDMDPKIKSFLDELLIQKGLVGLPAEGHDKALGELYATLENWLVTDMLQAFPNEQADDLERLMDNNPSQEQITKFFQDNIPNYEEVYSASLSSFKETYLS